MAENNEEINPHGSAPVTPGPSQFAGPPSAGSGWRRAWSNPVVKAGAALAAIVAIVVAITALGQGEPAVSNAPSGPETSVETTTTLPITTSCKMELAGWLDYALSPGGSLAAVAAEFGTSSAEYDAVETAWAKFAENLYVIGADAASTIAVQSLADDCDTIGDRYIPGRIAPN